MTRITLLCLLAMAAPAAPAPPWPERVKAMKQGQRVDVDLASGALKCATSGAKMELLTKWTIGLGIYGFLVIMGSIAGG